MTVSNPIPRRTPLNELFWASAAMLIVAAPVLLILTFLAVNQERAAELSSQAVVANSVQTIRETQKLANLNREVAADQRALVLTDAPGLAQRSRQALADSQAQMERMRPLFRGEPDQQRRMAALERQIVGLGQGGLARPGASEAQVLARYDQELTRLRAASDAIIAAELIQMQSSGVVNYQVAEHAHHRSKVLGVLVLIALAAAAVFAFSFIRLRTAMIRRMTADAGRLKAIFDGTMDAIITLNPSGGVESLNKAAETMFGYTQTELEGRDISVVAPLAPGEGLFLERLARHETLHTGRTCELEGRRNDGSSIPLDVNVGLMEQPDGAHVVAVMRDCTERKLAEQAKDEFVSTVSHELRTPLTSIAGSLGLLIGGAAGPLPPKAERLVGIAETNSRRLVRLINDILDIEKIESGAMQFSLRPIELGDLVGQAIDALSGLRAEYGVSFGYRRASAALMINGDADRLTQVVTNLLSNAAKFSPPGEQVEVSVEDAGGRVRIRVRDRGPGIPPEFHNRIFGKFAQADSSDTRAKNGTGLGLAITKEMVERHGGRIWFESPPGEGATFFVELPLAAQPQAAADSAGGPLLLLCEDDPHVAALITHALDDEGFNVRWTSTLAEADAALSDGAGYRALLLDLRLPDGNGLDLLSRLRTDPSTRALPVIIISADPASSVAGSLGIVDWIEKPLDLGRLRDALRQVTGPSDDLPLLLHVDDDPDLRQLVAEAFTGRCRLLSADSLASARERLQSITPQLVILDVGLPDGSGLDLLPQLVDQQGCALPVVIFSAHHVDRAALAEAVDAVLTKSRTSLSHLVRTVRMLVNKEPVSSATGPA